MKIKKWQYYSLLGYISIIYLLIFMGNRASLVKTSDITFLYSRASSLLDSLKDFNFGIFSYTNLHNLGYGDSFYYGGLTLIPFLPFISSGITTFTTVYFIAMVVTQSLGVYTLTKRVKNCSPRLFVLLYLSNTCVTACYFYTALLCSNLALGLGFFYIAFLIDFFRDRKSYIKASIMFFIIFETHTITAIILFCITVIVFFMYYDKKRWTDYINFGVVTSLFCAYRICNILYHLDTLNLKSNVLSDVIKKGSCFFSTTYAPFGGQIVHIIIKVITGATRVQGFGFCDLVMLLIVMICLIKNREKLTKRSKLLLVICLIGVVISQVYIWRRLDPFIQFPIRYGTYLALCLYFISLRYLRNKKVIKIIIMMDIVIATLLVILGGRQTVGSVTEKSNYIGKYVSAGEYLNFNLEDIDLDKFKAMSVQCMDLNTGNEYTYGFEGHKMTINVDKAELGEVRLRIPKLWYKGYRCYNKKTGKRYECKEGLYQFIEINIGNDTGKFVVEYSHPWWLWGIMFISYLSVIEAGIVYWRKYDIKGLLIQGANINNK